MTTRARLMAFPSTRGRLETLPRFFDWRITRRHNDTAAAEPKRIYFMLGHENSRLLSHILAFERHRLRRRPVVVVAGNDRRASRAAQYGLNVAALVAHASVVYWETLDMPLRGVRAFPRMFNAHYIRDAPNMGAAVARAAVDSKPRLLYASWGAYQPQLDMSPSCLDRQWARRWVARHRNATWLHSKRLLPVQYWEALPDYKFALVPSGMGVQSPKAFEALSVLTVPIVHHSNVAYAQLASEGWPLVRVRAWEDVTPENMTLWWNAMAPVLARARRCMLGERFYAMIFAGERMSACIASLRVRSAE